MSYFEQEISVSKEVLVLSSELQWFEIYCHVFYLFHNPHLCRLPFIQKMPRTYIWK